MPPYVTRDKQGQITSVSLQPDQGASEVATGSPELLDFMRKVALEHGTLLESDMHLVRVLEDLIDLLIARDLIRFTDLPLPAQDKLMERRSMRESLSGLELLSNNGDEETI
jgi:hypothetical protein